MTTYHRFTVELENNDFDVLFTRNFQPHTYEFEGHDEIEITSITPEPNLDEMKEIYSQINNLGNVEDYEIED